MLYSYAYGKSVGPSAVSATAPTLGSVTVGTLTATTAPLIFPSTGTYSYVGVTRIFNGVTTSFNVSPSLMVLSGSNYVWTDTVAFTSSPSVSYVITPYILGTPGLSQALTATIPLPSAISSVTAYNAGVGVFDVSWIGGVGVGVTYTYDVSSSGAIVSSGNYTTTALGTVNPTRITLTDNSAKTYTVVVKATNGVGTTTSGTSGSVTTLAPYTVRINSITTSSGSYAGDRKDVPSNNLQIGDGIVVGTSAYSDTNYNVFVFGQTFFTYTINYTCAIATSVQVLAVGGGGAGGQIGYGAAGGGGAGGVVLKTVSLPITTSTITISVGNGGITASDTGSNTTVLFTSYSSLNVVAGGGGGGSGVGIGSSGSSSGGSGGGGVGGSVAAGGTSSTSNGNLANNGGSGGSGALSYGGGGGGAGGAATTLNRGNGVQITTLYGIANCTPSGYSKLSTYYWGGGGGGAGNGLAGKGGCGAGSYNPVNDASGIAVGTYTVNGNSVGNGGSNTGGGGGGAWCSTNWGTGGSGIVIIAFPK